MDNFVVANNQSRNLWQTLEQVNAQFPLHTKNTTSLTFPIWISHNNTHQETYPLCKGCAAHVPYYRDLRPKCVIMTTTNQLIKFSVHSRKYKPTINTSTLLKNC